jgi:hypothetical protein
MQQRRLRLGDILDDYCPRERRITNHAVVAMIDDEVKQTRCTTCDAEHEYKQAKVPPARRKKLEAALGDGSEALLRRPSPDPDPVLETELEAPAAPEPEPQPERAASDDIAPSLAAAEEAPAEPPADADSEPAVAGEDEGPVHRRLIRATLPRPEGQVPERKIPDFTIRQPGRGGREFDGNKNGQRHGRRGGGMRFGGARHSGSGQGPRHGSGHGQGQGQGQGQRQHGPGHGQRQGGGGGGNRGGHGRGGGRKRGR